MSKVRKPRPLTINRIPVASIVSGDSCNDVWYVQVETWCLRDRALGRLQAWLTQAAAWIEQESSDE